MTYQPPGPAENMAAWDSLERIYEMATGEKLAPERRSMARVLALGAVERLRKEYDRLAAAAAPPSIPIAGRAMCKAMPDDPFNNANRLELKFHRLGDVVLMFNLLSKQCFPLAIEEFAAKYDVLPEPQG